MRASTFISLFISVVYLASVLPADAATHRHRRSAHRGATSAAGTNDPRYADFVIDPQTGEVFHSVNADARRYPASLTKMMTLYLLFEALEQKKVTLNTPLKVSDYAATMPQTNLALSPGDEIPVDTAIKALVVRSANDVAVVVGENLGGDVDHFAEMMTAKAHQLGMTGTHFANPNGLPNPEQYTTAHDMARLGIALKRDFPKYYPYFSVRQFSWAGVSYYTHNRVMLRYAGVDGIKTGFIGNSGFNLVTSCKRGGRPVIGVVMGGSSGRWRDDRMIQLLNQTYATIASRGASRGPTNGNPPASDGSKPDDAADNAAPEPALANAGDDDADAAKQDATAANTAKTEPAKPGALTAKASVQTPAAPVNPSIAAVANTAAVPVAATSVVKPVASVAATPLVPIAAAKASTAALVPVTPPATHPLITPANTPLPSSVKPAAASPSPAASLPNTNDWSIQVGAFSNQQTAVNAAQKAYHLAVDDLTGAHVRVAPPPSGKAGIYRALLVNISEAQATKACVTLVANKTPCITQQIQIPAK